MGLYMDPTFVFGRSEEETRCGRLSPYGAKRGQPRPAGTQYPKRRSWRVVSEAIGVVDQGMSIQG
jgi:hypothetical protein